LIENLTNILTNNQDQRKISFILALNYPFTTDFLKVNIERMQSYSHLPKYILPH